MICSVCDTDSDLCDQCSGDLPQDFFCFEGSHFCLQSCWGEWLISENEGGLELAQRTAGNKKG